MLTSVCPKLLAKLDEAKLPVITGCARWVLIDFRGVVYEAAKAAGFVLEPCQGMAGIDFELPANKAVLEVLVKNMRARRFMS